MSKETEPFKTYLDTLLIIKIWFPALLLVVVWISLQGTFWAFLSFGLPLLVWALFNATACEVQAEEQGLRYR